MSRAGARGLEIALPEAARCVAVAEDGTLVVGLRDHVEVFDAKGQRRAIWDSLGKRCWLTALAVGANDVFAADSGNRVLLRYDKSGRLVSRIGEKNKERGVPGFIIPSPYLDVVIGRDGLLRVNNPGRHRVEAYTFSGDFEGAWGQPAMGIDGFCGCCNPIGLALLPDGRLVTCEKGLPRVKVCSDQGRFESVVAGTESFPENAKACSDLNDCTHGGMDAAVDSKGRIYILDLVAADIRVMRRNTKA
jgi:sugar lactone lactonase YvrE